MSGFEPVFDFASANSVRLHAGRAEVIINGVVYAGNGEVRLDLLPRAGIRLYGNFQSIPLPDAMRAALDPQSLSSFSINGRQIQGFPLDIKGGGSDQPFLIKWCPKFDGLNGAGEESTQLTRVVFHIFNFEDLRGMRWSREQNGSTEGTIQHLDLSSGEWKVELKSLIVTGENIKALKAEGGYRLTHVGCLEKVDSSSFSGKDAGGWLIALEHFLSFAKAGRCAPVCPVGFDASGNRVWEVWSSPREAWRTPQSWFDSQNSSQLATLFPLFMKQWANDSWREALEEVIYWYVNANDSLRGIDAGIILTQAAIERLSYEFSVKDRRLLTVNGFKDLWASDKFRLLFSSLGIPLEIPSELSELQRLASNGQMNWIDAPHAVTEIRNSLIHPEHRQRGQFKVAYYEGWNLGLWYLEIGILAICGYVGTYGNRLRQRWVGQVDDVPWKK